MKNILLLLLVCTGVYAQSEIQNFKGTLKNNSVDSIIVKNQRGTWRKGYALDKQGNFSGRLQQGLGMFTLHYGDNEAEMYLGNDSDIVITANADNFIETLVYTGKGADENIFLAEYARGKKALIDKFKDGGDKEVIQKEVDSLIAVFEDKLKTRKYNFMFRNLMSTTLKYSDSQILPMQISKQATSKRLEGKPSPLFTYENHKGGTTSLKDLRGKYVYIDVWATWCGPCRREIPHLQEIEEKYKGENIAFVSISVDKENDYNKWRELVTKETLGGIQLIADDNFKSDFIQSYNILSIPRFILIDPKGNVVKADAPRPSDFALQDLLNKLLK
ncbi:TlpA family protein disulfide reductase [Flavobacterium arcticum]|uniref:TlpA family protein disulfide reductase n=1 Tax=Flavobacterium arcticum TaxID=1784713 RepID=A0A345HAC8_9FLAO|nr:TlpA disulfide reductase family protein [Flavobacterium arcticum]AXG73538.1 TlpA family protein disulfide reductase [Flavobacterium arcticum]KAF2513329.1 TlpA family protein disulfide reductase [Flavobacterium arcticum]